MATAFTTSNWSSLQEYQNYLQGMRERRKNGRSGGANNTNTADAAFNSARKANEDRYNEILSMLQDRYNRLTGQVDSIGAQGEADIRANMAKVGAQQQARLTSRGLANTTVPSTVATGTARETEAAVGNYRDALTRYKIGLDQQLSGDVAGFMERRTDSYPDTSSLVQDARIRASAGGGASTGGGGQPYQSRFSQPFEEQEDPWASGEIQYGVNPSLWDENGNYLRSYYNARTPLV